MKHNIAGMSLLEMESLMAPLGMKPYRARQIFKWIHRKACFDFDSMSDISKPARSMLSKQFRITFPSMEKEQIEQSRTRKVGFRLEDGHFVEAVLIPDRNHATICLSTQVGCALACRFCMSGSRGFMRNLEPHEIIGQFLLLRARTDVQSPVNLVLMGMGEPCLNLDNVLKAVHILKEELGASISMRRTTLSTAGVLPGIRRLAGEEIRPHLAVSLNAPTNELRSRLMPVNRQYPMEALFGVLRAFPLRRGEKITFEYVLIDGMNDSVADARLLTKLLREVPSKVNLIPMNPIDGKPFKAPPAERMLRFAETLREAGFIAVQRRSRGGAIRAACGQLAMDDCRPCTGHDGVW